MSLVSCAGGHKFKAVGGRGGAGGSILLRATRKVLGLGAVPRRANAGVGTAGGRNGMTGGCGADRVIQVPVGTVVKRLEVLPIYFIYRYIVLSCLGQF